CAWRTSGRMPDWATAPNEGAGSTSFNLARRLRSSSGSSSSAARPTFRPPTPSPGPGGKLPTNPSGTLGSAIEPRPEEEGERATDQQDAQHDRGDPVVAVLVLLGVRGGHAGFFTR